MSDQNKVILEGVVCNEPKVFDGKSRLIMFRIATQRDGMKWPERNSVKVWDQVGARVAEGDRVRVEGILKTEKYGDENDPKFWTGCVTESIEILSPGDDDLPY